ncbi:MAG: nuclear transport factor 2 family protein [Armatimonadota bacterium]
MCSCSCCYRRTMAGSVRGAGIPGPSKGCDSMGRPDSGSLREAAAGTPLGVSASAEDVEAITQACRDYYQAWYTADAQRMERCLHPDLAKRNVARDPKDGSWALSHLDGRVMVAKTGEGAGTARTPEGERWVHITIRDVYGHIACATVIAYLYVEYLHLAKFDDRWLIVNAIWERREGYSRPDA